MYLPDPGPLARPPANPPPDSRARADQALAAVTDDRPLSAADLHVVVLLNLGLADAMASRYAGRGVEREDLVQVARLGLVKAAQRFRPAVGRSFAGFALPTISGEIKRHFRDAGWMVRPPRRLQELGARVREAEKTLEQDLRRPPTSAEVATNLSIEVADVDEAHEATSGFHAVSLDVPGTVTQLQGSGALDELDDPFGAVDDAAWLGEALAGLTDRERQVLRLRFSDLLTQSEIAARIGVSQMQISRILRATLARLRQRLESTSGRAA